MKIYAFDIETASAADRFRYGTGFVRLCGWGPVGSDEITVSTDPAELIAALMEADAITGHNIVDFDLQALAFWNGADYDALCRKSFDTLLGARHLEPVAAQGAQPNGYYKLDSVATRYGVPAKSHVDFAGKLEIVRRIRSDKEADRMAKARTAAIAKAMRDGKDYNPETSFGVLDLLKDLYGGYDLIPLDDPDYIRYLRQDVATSKAVYREMATRVAKLPREGDGSRAYLRREHYTQRDTGFTTLAGARVNEEFTRRKHAEGQARLAASQRMLTERYGMPTTGTKPHTSKPGKAAFRAALISTGIDPAALDRVWPKAKDGSLLTGKDVLNQMIESFTKFGRTEAAELCETIKAMNGERSVYGTFLDHLGPDGRVHPEIVPEQSSGRWSMRKPGATVLGKRGGKARERGIILADTDEEVLVAIDADQVDARAIAGLSQDQEYMKLFLPGTDLHSEVALRVFGRQQCREEMARNNGRCDCEYREKAKVFGHGWNYGLGAKAMAAQHGVAIELAYQFAAGMQEAFPVLCAWKDEQRELAGAMPFGEEPPENDTYRILYTGFGRPVRVERKRAYTQATAQLGQGTTRDIMAEALLKLPVPYRRRVRAIVHDEFVLSLPKENAQETAQQIADSMAFDFRGVAITFGCSRVAQSWAGCYGEQYEEAT